MIEKPEPFAARLFFYPNGDILIRQCEKRDCVYKMTSHPGVVVKPGNDQAERLLHCAQQARIGKLAAPELA